MDISEHIGLVAKASLFRKIEFVRYRKPCVTEYPPNSVVLNPKHTAKAMRQHLDGDDGEPEGQAQQAGSRSRVRPPGADEDDPRYQPEEEMFCNDASFATLLHAQWKERGELGMGLDNMGNTCFLNSVLQCLAHTPPIAQYVMNNFKSANSNAAAPIDFAFFLADTTRKIHRLDQGLKQVSNGASHFRPAQIVSNLRALSKHFKPGQQCDANEFLVYLIQGCQNSLLFRITKGASASKKYPLRVANTTPLMRVVSGYLRSQVAWSRNDEIQMLKRANQHQNAADLEIQKRQTGAGDALYSNTYDPFTVMSLHVAGPTLQHCLDDYCKVEVLDGRCYQSPRKVGVRATKCLKIHVPPPVLTIQLKRFDGMRAKVNKSVAYPAVLDVRRYCTDGLDASASTVYDLCAITVHIGTSLSYGHYIAFVKTRSGLWACCDDSRVGLVSQDSAMKQQAYMLFYTRREASSAAAKRQKSEAVPNNSGSVASVTKPSAPVTTLKAGEQEGVELTEEEVHQAVMLRRKAQLSSGPAPLPTPSVAQLPPSSLPTQQTAHTRFTGDLSTDSDDDEVSNNRPVVPKQSPAVRPSKVPSGAPLRYSGIAAALGRGSARSPRLSALKHVEPHSEDLANIIQHELAVSTAPGDVVVASQKRPRDEPEETNDNDAPITEKSTSAVDPRNADEGDEVAKQSVALTGAAVVKQLNESRGNERLDTVQRPRHLPLFKQTIRDEQWDREMDKGRMKKMRRKESETSTEGDGTNKFQSASVSFDSRGRREKSDADQNNVAFMKKDKRDRFQETVRNERGGGGGGGNSFGGRGGGGNWSHNNNQQRGNHNGHEGGRGGRGGRGFGGRRF